MGYELPRDAVSNFVAAASHGVEGPERGLDVRRGDDSFSPLRESFPKGSGASECERTHSVRIRSRTL
jgi:hypothetical protein